MQAVAPPAEAIQAAMIATAASCAVGAVIGAVAGTRKVHSMLRTLLLATGACASAAIALGLLIRFQSFPLQRAVDRSPWAITVGCIVAIAVSSLAHLLRQRTLIGSQSTLKLLLTAGTGVALRASAIAASLVIVNWRLISKSWSITETVAWIAPASMLGAIAWTVIDNAVHVRRCDSDNKQTTSHHFLCNVFFSTALPLLIGAGIAAKLLLDAGLSTFPPALGATFAGITAAIVACAVTYRVIHRNEPDRWTSSSRGFAGAAIVVLTTTWLVGMWTSSASAWMTPTKPAIAGICILLGVSLPSVFLEITRNKHLAIRLSVPVVIAAVFCGAGAALLHTGNSAESGTYDYEYDYSMLDPR